MPISREEFTRGRIDLMVPIAHLLEDYPDLAFTADEVLQMLIETTARNPSLEEVEQELDALASQQRVQVAELEGTRWYIINIVERGIGFLRG